MELSTGVGAEPVRSVAVGQMQFTEFVQGDGPCRSWRTPQSAGPRVRMRRGFRTFMMKTIRHEESSALG